MKFCSNLSSKTNICYYLKSQIIPICRRRFFKKTCQNSEYVENFCNNLIIYFRLNVENLDWETAHKKNLKSYPNFIISFSQSFIISLIFINSSIFIIYLTFIISHNFMLFTLISCVLLLIMSFQIIFYKNKFSFPIV